MKILLCFCACLTTAYTHGVISYPVSPFSYSTYISPFTTITRPVGVTYTGFHGYPVALGSSYFPLGVVPNNVIYTGIPGVVHYFPVAPAGDKGKPDKKKPNEKKDDKETKEEATEEPKKEEEATEPKTDETEDLAE